MRTIAVVNEKGGTGKTTTTVNLSAALGEMGKKVLLVDLDGQAAASRWLGVEGDPRFADALWAGTGLQPIEEVLPNVALAPGHGKLDVVAHDLRPTQGGQLRKLLSELDGFDYVLIDCPPSLGNRLIGNALLASDCALVPVETSVLPLDGLRILLTTLDDVRQGFGHPIELGGVVAVRFDARTRISRLVLEELNRALPGRVFNTVIRETVRMRECPATSQSILSYAPDCNGAEDYRALAAELVARETEGASEDLSESLMAAYDCGEGNDHWKQIAAHLKPQSRRQSRPGAGASCEPDNDALPVEADHETPSVAAEVQPMRSADTLAEEFPPSTEPLRALDLPPATQESLTTWPAADYDFARDEPDGEDGETASAAPATGWKKFLKTVTMQI